MNCSHIALLNTKMLVQYLGHRGKAVGGTGSIRHNGFITSKGVIINTQNYGRDVLVDDLCKIYMHLCDGTDAASEPNSVETIKTRGRGKKSHEKSDPEGVDWESEWCWGLAYNSSQTCSRELGNV